jgi:two-component sensor histidine kinase
MQDPYKDNLPFWNVTANGWHCIRKRVCLIVMLYFSCFYDVNAQVFYQLNPVNTEVILKEINKHFAQQGIKFFRSDFYTPPDLNKIGTKKYNTILTRTGQEVSTIRLNNLFGKAFYNEGVSYISEHFFRKAEMLLNRASSNAERSTIYANLADLYARNENFGKADYYYQKLLALPLKNIDLYQIMNAYCSNLIRLNKVNLATEKLGEVQLTNPPKTSLENLFYQMALARCKIALGQYSEAATLSSKSLAASENSGYLYYQCLLESSILNLKMGNPHEALLHLKKAQSFSSSNENEDKAQLFELLSNAYVSASDNKMAYEYLSKKKLIKDSVYKQLKFKNLLELEFQYEKNKQSEELTRKEKTVKILRQDQKLLDQRRQIEKSKVLQAKLIAQERQTELNIKEKDINYFKKQLSSRERQLSRAEVIKWVTITAGILLTIILFLVYRQFRLKSRSKKLIERKNNLLQELLSERTSLMQEMHAQVKGNLNTVIGLLKPKSTEVDNSALKALKDSENRIFAMSLIHEKLFRTESLSQINIKDYVGELIANLNKSFRSGDNISIVLRIEPVFLNQEQAVPLGIIINEAVTNAFKYAFPNRKEGTVWISFTEGPDGFFNLLIRDDGVGLPPGFKIRTIVSLGFKLIKGLAHQLDGELEITSEGGTCLAVYNIRQTIGKTLTSNREAQLV